MQLDVKPFRADCTDKEAAFKVLEEASEAREAWQELDSTLAMKRHLGEVNSAKTLTGSWVDAASRHLADEIADCITACANLAERYGLDMQAALDRVERKNRERGRYDG